MKPEIEAKFLAVDHQELRDKLEQLGAECRRPMRVMQRKNFDFADHRLEHERNGWVRVRDEGNKTTLAYKQLNDRSLTGTQEVSVVVSDFDTTCQLLEQIGLVASSYQETKRESWVLDDVEIELDEWPWVKPYVELEGPDEATVRTAAEKLGLDWSQAKHGSVEVVYTAEYDVTDAEVDGWSEITFIPVPDWLEAKRR